MNEDGRGHVSTGSRAPHERRPCGLSCGGAGVEGRTAVSRLPGRFRKRFDFIVDPDRAAGDDFRINPTIAMPQRSHQRARNVEIACRGLRVDVGGGASDDALDHLEADVADRERMVEKVEFAPGRPAANIKVGAEA